MRSLSFLILFFGFMKIVHGAELEFVGPNHGWNPYVGLLMMRTLYT